MSHTKMANLTISDRFCPVSAGGRPNKAHSRSHSGSYDGDAGVPQSSLHGNKRPNNPRVTGLSYTEKTTLLSSDDEFP